jgi:O-antigen/teichoic acid export membrane protein
MGQTVPVFSYIDAEDDAKILKQVYFLLLKISTILSVYIGGMLIIMGRPFILRWMGEGFETSYTVLAVLTVGLTFALSQFPTYNLLRGVSKHFIVMVCSLGEGIGNILLSVALVSKYGIVGIAFGTMVPMVLSMVFVMPFLMSRHIYYFKLFEFYFKVLGPAFFKAFFLMLCIYFLAKPFLLPEYFQLFFIGAASLLYFPIIYVLGFSKYEKRKFLMPRTRMLKFLSRCSIV